MKYTLLLLIILSLGACTKQKEMAASPVSAATYNFRCFYSKDDFYFPSVSDTFSIDSTHLRSHSTNGYVRKVHSQSFDTLFNVDSAFIKNYYKLCSRDSIFKTSPDSIILRSMGVSIDKL